MALCAYFSLCEQIFEYMQIWQQLLIVGPLCFNILTA